MLAPAGLTPARVSGFTHGCGFVRHDSCPNLYQQLATTFAGRRHEAVVAYAQVSVTKWFAFKGLTEPRVLKEIAQDQERCWTIVRSTREAKLWEELLVRVAPTKVVELAAQQGSALLERTAMARRTAAGLLETLDAQSGVAMEVDRLGTVLRPEKVAEAERLASRLGIVQVPGAKLTYVLACLAVLEGDKAGSFVAQDPLLNNELLWQIELVADGILSWDENAGIRSGER